MHQTLPPAIRKFRLGVAGVERGIPYDFGRCRGPFYEMAREDSRLEIIEPHAFFDDIIDPSNPMATTDWHFLARCDALYFANPLLDVHNPVILTAKQLGIPVWADYGDDPFHVRMSNPAFPMFSDEEGIRANVQWVMKYADLISIISPTAMKSFPLETLDAADRRKVQVLGDCVRWPAAEGLRRKLITWRGMSSHEEDVESILPDLVRVAGDPAFADWQWALFGEPPLKLKEQLSAALGEPWRPGRKGKRFLLAPYFGTPMMMFECWKNLRPFLHIVPLADNAFSRAKPPNAWMEATAAGAAVIGPDFEEWQVPGMIHYSTSPIAHNGKETFEAVLRREMAKFTVSREGREGGEDDATQNSDANPPIGERHPAVKEARLAVYPALTQRSVNQKRWAALRKLAEFAKVPGAETAASKEIASLEVMEVAG